MEEQEQAHSNQKHIILHAVGAAAHYKPAFPAMHQDNAQYQDDDRDHSCRFDVAVHDQEQGTGHVRELYRPGNRQPERREAKRVEVERPEIMNAAVEHARHAVHEQDHRKREP